MRLAPALGAAPAKTSRAPCGWLSSWPHASAAAVAAAMCASLLACASASTMGPTSVAGSRGSPTTRSRAAPVTRSRNSSYTASCTTMREAAEHFWPWKAKADATTPTTASSMSALSSTMSAFLPPISAMTRLNSLCPGASLAARSTMCAPTSREPVKTTVGMSACATSASPTTSPRPCSSCRQSGGAPAASRMECTALAVSGVCSAGFITTGLPVTSAALLMPHRMAKGKFHGAMMAATPRGRCASTFSSPRKRPSWRGSKRRTASRA
mmetsp:Transcript_3306/g.10319  ORF Transcript_3306/g.10319 Transcript_3306/m.10319 type:complete len:268 (-) Transcript_3306:91-894(-)